MLNIHRTIFLGWLKDMWSGCQSSIGMSFTTFPTNPQPESQYTFNDCGIRNTWSLFLDQLTYDPVHKGVQEIQTITRIKPLEAIDTLWDSLYTSVLCVVCCSINLFCSYWQHVTLWEFSQSLPGGTVIYKLLWIYLRFSKAIKHIPVMRMGHISPWIRNTQKWQVTKIKPTSQLSTVQNWVNERAPFICAHSTVNKFQQLVPTSLFLLSYLPCLTNTPFQH